MRGELSLELPNRDIPSLTGIPITQRVCPCTLNSLSSEVFLTGRVKFYQKAPRLVEEINIGLVTVKSISSKKDARGIVSGASKWGHSLLNRNTSNSAGVAIP